MIAVLFEADALPEAQERYLQLAAGLTPFAFRHAGVYRHRAFSEPEFTRQNPFVILVGR